MPILADTEDQVLALIKQSEEAALKLVASVSESIGKALPADTDTEQVMGLLEKPAGVIDQVLAFTAELIATQRAFVSQLVDTLVPTPEATGSAKPAPKRKAAA